MTNMIKLKVLKGILLLWVVMMITVITLAVQAGKRNDAEAAACESRGGKLIQIKETKSRIVCARVEILKSE